MTENFFVDVTWLTSMFIFGWLLGILLDIIVSKILSHDSIKDNMGLIILVFICHMWFYMSINYIVKKIIPQENNDLNNSSFMLGLFVSQIISFTKYRETFTQYYEKRKLAMKK